MQIRVSRLCRLFGLLLISGLLFGCGGGVSLPVAPGDPDKPPPQRDPTWSQDIEPVLSSSTCASAACHGGTSPSLSLLLAAGAGYHELVDVPSKQDKTLKLIVPGDPDNSYLVIKLEGRNKRGDPMPNSGTPLSPTLLAALRQWIALGAPEN